MSASPELEQVLGSSLGVEQDLGSSCGAESPSVARQDAPSGDGPTREQFVGWMADRFTARGGFAPSEREQAVRYASDCLNGFMDSSLPLIEFGSEAADWDWTESGAHDLADTDLSYWEA